MGASRNVVAIVLLGFVAASGWVFAGGQRPLTQAERRAIHARVMDQGEAGQIPYLLGLRSDDIFLPNSLYVDPIVGADNEVLLLMVCASQVTVVARAGKPESFMTAGEGWIYTEWPFEITDVIKAQPEYRLQPSRTMTVLQSGGTIRVNGRAVTAAPFPHWPDIVTGSTYMLFAGSRVPETGAFQVFQGIEMGPPRRNEKTSRYPSLRRLQPELLKAMALRQAKAAAARSHCRR